MSGNGGPAGAPRGGGCVALIGMPGAGKGTVGVLLARRAARAVLAALRVLT